MARNSLITTIKQEYSDVLESFGFQPEDGEEMFAEISPQELATIEKSIEGTMRRRIRFRMLMNKLGLKFPQADSVSEIDTLNPIKQIIEEAHLTNVRLLEALEVSLKSQKTFYQSIQDSNKKTQEAMQEILRLIKEMRMETMTVRFSKASTEKVADMFNYFNLTVRENAQRSDFISDEKFQAFPQLDIQLMSWSDNKTLSIPAALQYINQVLIDHRVSLMDEIVDENHELFSRDRSFKLLNVSDQNQLSLASDSPNFKGRLDGVIVPMKIGMTMFQMQIRAGIELKNPNQVATASDWKQAINQARVQIVAANVQSYHPVIHLLTDLVSRFMLFKIADRLVYEYDCPDAPTAFKSLANWLNCSSTESAYIYEEGKTQVNEELMPSMTALLNLQRKSRSCDGLKDQLAILDDLEPEERPAYLYQTLMGRFGDI